jgi:hypothetical protein
VPRRPLDRREQAFQAGDGAKGLFEIAEFVDDDQGG